MSAQQKLDTLSPEETKRFMLHYNFPPYSVGEVRRMGGTGRREIGHGALGERALEPVIPTAAEFPYTIRIVSEVLGSNGSTSQGSICAGTLALMDAGVPIKDLVAGVAMGLITSDEGEDYKILTDIAGLEDHLGDMDFKVAGTKDGITAVQADFKIDGLTLPMVEEIIERARTARLYILGKLEETLPESRKELSRYAPRMYRIQIPREKIGVVIGPGGKMIRTIIEETKCSVDVEDDGSIFIGSSNEENAQKAIAIIEGLTKEATIGQTYTGRVTRTVDFGAFVEIMPGKEGLVRIGELADYRVPTVEDVVKVGDEITVMVTEIDNLGRINLSRRAVLEGATPEDLEGPEPGEIPSPMTRRTSTLSPDAPAPAPADASGRWWRRRRLPRRWWWRRRTAPRRRWWWRRASGWPRRLQRRPASAPDEPLAETGIMRPGPVREAGSLYFQSRGRDMDTIRVVVSGSGYMGREVLAALVREPDLEPVGVIEKFSTEGSHRCPAAALVPMSNDPTALIAATKPQVIIDFSNAEWTPSSPVLRWSTERRWSSAQRATRRPSSKSWQTGAVPRASAASLRRTSPSAPSSPHTWRRSPRATSTTPRSSRRTRRRSWTRRLARP